MVYEIYELTLSILNKIFASELPHFKRNALLKMCSFRDTMKNMLLYN